MVGKAQAITNSQVPASSVAWIPSSTHLLAAVPICSFLNHSARSLGKSREIVTQWTRLLWVGCSCFTQICHLTSSALWPFFAIRILSSTVHPRGERNPKPTIPQTWVPKRYSLSTNNYYEQEIQKRLIRPLSPHSWITQWFLHVCFAAKSAWHTFMMREGRCPSSIPWPLPVAFFVWFCGKTHNGEREKIVKNSIFYFRDQCLCFQTCTWACRNFGWLSKCLCTIRLPS